MTEMPPLGPTWNDPHPKTEQEELDEQAQILLFLSTFREWEQGSIHICTVPDWA